MAVSIYGLRDPRDGVIRYVGRTANDPRQRLRQHTGSAGVLRWMRLSEWILELRAAGVRPEIVVLEEVAADVAGAAEQRWIVQLDDPDHPLVNITYTGRLSPSVEQARIEQARRVEQARLKRAVPHARTDLPTGSDDDVATVAARRVEIRAFRTRHRLSQKRLASLLGVSEALVSRWERGSRMPDRWIDLALRESARSLPAPQPAGA